MQVANDDERKLYRLIRARTLASQMSDARARTKIIANIKTGSESIPDFTVVGSRVIFDGWLKADPDARGEDVELPKVAKNDDLKLLEVTSDEKWTEPPSRYTEAGLVKRTRKARYWTTFLHMQALFVHSKSEYVQKINKHLSQQIQAM